MIIENIFLINYLIICNFLYIRSFLSRETDRLAVVKMLILPILIFILWGLYIKNSNYFFVIKIVVLFFAGAVGQVAAAIYEYITVINNEKV